ncbi:VCBS repeat-containing protein [Streptomyces sp. NPDC001941]|uniref:FG-GAP repeat domain-containing protein n=1 Tax=Streptomyces sp. NPDC001941 TaxID=3154659 RepID=UPI00332AFBBC
MHARDFAGIALVPALALGLVGAAVATTVVTASTALAADRTWPAPVALTGEKATSPGAKVLPDGTAVTVWQKGVGEEAQEVWAATRPADATAWGAPVLVASNLKDVSDVFLVAAKDGSATVSWRDTAQEGPNRYRTATLASGATAWTAPATLTTAPYANDLRLVNGEGGHLTAVWSGNPTPGENDQDEGVFVSDLAATGDAWSPAVQVGIGYPYELAAAAGSDGTVTVAWKAALDGAEKLRVSTRAPGAAQWSAPEPVNVGGTNPSEISVQFAATGATLLTWDGATRNRGFVYRPAGSAQWGPSEGLPVDADRGDTSTPLIEADGSVSAVWVTDSSKLAVANRAVGGAWSAPTVLEQDRGVLSLWTPGIGRDGTLAIAWTTFDHDLFAVTRSDGWGKPVRVGKVYEYAQGTVAAGADGRAVTVWNELLGRTGDSREINKVWAASTGGPRTAAPAARRDYVGNDRVPDVYARGTDGRLTVFAGSAAGTFSERNDGGFWPTTSTIVPFGDFTGDGVNETLVTDWAGDLYRYSPASGAAVTDKSPSVKIGSGWSAYDGLTYSGDFTGDGIPDLVARHTATGDLYLYGGTKAGGFTRTGKIGTSWKSLTIVGAGDLNGDRNADLIARTTNGDLYRYYGTGKGTIGSGTKIGSGWGGMADFIGTGDLTGDGRDDILGRTATGDLYRYAGNGAGGIGSGVKIGTGWKTYASVR